MLCIAYVHVWNYKAPFEIKSTKSLGGKAKTLFWSGIRTLDLFFLSLQNLQTWPNCTRTVQPWTLFCILWFRFREFTQGHCWAFLDDVDKAKVRGWPEPYIYIWLRVGHDLAETRRVWGSPSLGEPLSRCGRHSSASKGVHFLGKFSPIFPAIPKNSQIRFFCGWFGSQAHLFEINYLHWW